MLFDGPGGWSITPGWWKRTPDDFSDQLHWCEMCGAALDTIPRDANESIDDVSPEMFELLKSVHSPKLQKKHIHIYSPEHEDMDNDLRKFQKGQYIGDYSQRIGTSNQNILPRFIGGIFFYDADYSYEDNLNILRDKLGCLDEVALVLDEQTRSSCNILKDLQGTPKLNIVVEQNSNIGVSINAALKSFSKQDWIVFVHPANVFPPEMRKNILGTFLNPGILYFIDCFYSKTQNPLPLFSPNALALRQAGFDGIAQCRDFEQFINLWPKDKQIQSSLPFKSWLATNENEWKERIDQNFFEDREFVSRLSLVMSQALPDKGNILVTQSASFYLTRALTRLLLNMGYNVHLLSHERFISHFRDILPTKQIIAFKNPEMIKFKDLFSLCAQLREKFTFQGAVVPYSSPRRILEPKDGYQDIEKIAEYIAGKIVCRVNIKREFITGHKDHDVTHDNPWSY